MKPDTLSAFLMRQSFRPGWAGLLVNPFYFIRRELYRHIRDLAPRMQGRLLDFGCGRKPYEDLFRVDEYIGLDMEQTGHEHAHSKIDVYYDGRRIPFPDANFDSVFCSEVFEHVFNLPEVLAELHRVIKPGGKMLITVPFCWNEHEAPYDFGRYSSFGIRHILEQQGFRVLEQRKSGHFAQVQVQLLALYFHSLIQIRNYRLAFLLRMLLIIPVNLLGALLLPLLPRNRSLYFNNVVLAEKIPVQSAG